MDSIEDITSEHLHAKADEYEAAAKRYRAAAVALEDPETGQPKPKRRAPRRAQSTNGTVTEDAVLKHLTSEGVRAADIRGKLRGSEAQVLRKLKSLEAAGKAKRTGERRTTRWHKVA